MKSPWDLASRGQDDMETLQTDVMRFMAILGLCLAAIFSLVKSPDFKAPVEAPAAATPASASAAQAGESRLQPESAPDAPVVAPAVESAPASSSGLPPPPLKPPTDENKGFVLEFESAPDLAALVAGGSVTLVVKAEDEFWRWSDEAGLTAASGITGYYAMEERTVPASFRSAAERQLGAGSKAWGVLLPAAIRRQIESLVERHSGGVLTISADGIVSRGVRP